MSGGGTMLPLPGGGAPDANLVYTPPVRTLLSLPRYAQIMGINPIQFMSGSDGGNLFPTTGCTDRWWQYPWQDPNRISRNELSDEIKRAEQDIASQLKYWPGLQWMTSDRVTYPRYHRRELTALRGYTPNGHYKSVRPRYGKYAQGGVRDVTVVSAGVSLVFSDEDSDGFNETVTISAATTLTDANEIRVFNAGFNGDERYEIRQARSKSISGGTFTAIFDAWLFFKLELLAAWPGSSPTGPSYIDATAAGSYVPSVDVYRVHSDPEEQCMLYWEGAPGNVICGSCSGTGCEQCSPITQTACTQTSSHGMAGSLIVTPAIYDGATQTFTPTTFCAGREPDYVELNYQGGDYELLNGSKSVPHDLAQAITYIATARLSRPLCTECENVRAKEQWLIEDLIFIQAGERSDTRFVTQEVMKCPFGTKRGEVEAWRIIKSRIRVGDVNTRLSFVG